jgi:NADH-quinone oxidoreductase subunit D
MNTTQQPDYYLPPKEDVYNMESLIYHFKIVMGEVPVPVAEIYHPVEWRYSSHLVTDGSRTPYRLRRPCFIYYQAYPEMIKGALLSDAIVILSSLNVIAGELDA